MTPAIIVRNPRFLIGSRHVRAAAKADLMAMAFYSGLSVTFPSGERFFVQSVRRFAHLARGQLAQDVAAFVQQEGHHAREHAALNDLLTEAGYDAEALEARAQHRLDVATARGPLAQLAATAALEHITAILAERLLTDPRHLAFAEPELRVLWRWHAVEEIEHKSVAFDVFMAATADWSPFKRWLVRILAMVRAVAHLCSVTLANVADILAAEGKRRWSLEFLIFACVRPGVVGQLSGPFRRYFRPGFHPTHLGSPELLEAARRDLGALGVATDPRASQGGPVAAGMAMAPAAVAVESEALLQA